MRKKTIGSKIKKNLHLTLLYSVVILSCVLLLLGGVKFWIFQDASSYAKSAEERFQTTKTMALIAVIDSDTHSLEDKNKAIWALGVLKEQSALPKLQSLLTGEECQHGEHICQYEVAKAIAKIEGNLLASSKTLKKYCN